MSERLESTLEAIRGFVRERDWEQYHNPKNLVMAVASEAGELLDVFRWLHTEEADEVREDPEKMRQVEDEMADVAICLLMLCDRLDIDFFAAIERKLEENRQKYPVDEVKGRHT